jgi:hypothetical protein
MPWSRPFDEPIQPPKGKRLVTLKDAAAYILALPKAKQQSPEWQAAGSLPAMMTTTTTTVAESRGLLPDGPNEPPSSRARSVPATVLDRRRVCGGGNALHSVVHR